MRRMNLIHQQENQSGSISDEEADNAILHVNGDGAPPFVIKGKINNQPFRTMLDSGSPIRTFTQGRLKFLN